jgi:hypothetical protein
VVTVRRYLLSVPERLLRSVVGLGAGATRELSEVAVPRSIRGTKLYEHLVGTTLQFLIEQVGGVEGVYARDALLADDFLKRRTAGNVIEGLGIVAFRASPVWVLAALSDLSGFGRQLIPQVAEALKADGLLDRDATATTIEHLLDGLERTSGRLAASVNTPPLDVATLRAEWRDLRDQASTIPRVSLPSAEAVMDLWTAVTNEAARQEKSVFALSSVMAVSAAGRLPDHVRWLSVSAALAVRHTGRVVASALLEDYRRTLADLSRTGYVRYAIRQARPYVRAALQQYSPGRRTMTERLLDRFRRT